MEKMSDIKKLNDLVLTQLDGDFDVVAWCEQFEPATEEEIKELGIEEWLK